MTELMNLFKLLQPAQRLPEPHPSARMNDADWLRDCLINRERYIEQSQSTRNTVVPDLAPLPELQKGGPNNLQPHKS